MCADYPYVLLLSLFDSDFPASVLLGKDLLILLDVFPVIDLFSNLDLYRPDF